MSSLRFFIFVSLICLAVQPLMAGEVHPELQHRIANLPDTAYVRVWIQLNDTTPRGSLQQALAAMPSRAERHAVGIAQLKEQSQEQQKTLLAELETLRRSRKANNTVAHWIANVIESDIAVGELNRLAQRPEVARIIEQPLVTAIGAEVTTGTRTPQAPSSSLTYIRADSAWKLGYTGKGRIICSFDTGVDGAHRALNRSWKGNDGDSAAAWYDPLFHQTLPHPLSGTVSNNAHGTWTMGVMVGADSVSGDTTGVAPDAQWISAGVVDLPGASLLSAFEWAVDPDGDPNTLADVPDVINNSWGFIGRSCVDIFYTAVQNAEALGIVNIFAAGNEGSAPSSVRNPADGAFAPDDSLSLFAIGNVSETSDTISGNSSRGPSPCSGAIKPNVAAPGVGVRTTAPGNLFTFASGTSLAAPYVSGLVTLLRQKNPNATVDQIKQALLASGRPLGYTTIPNNDIGWGLIDCVDALNALAAVNSTPNVKLYDFTHAPILPGDTVTGTVVLQNLGSPVSNVQLNITGNNPSLTVIDGLALFGTIAEGDTVRSSDSITVIVSDTVTDGSLVPIAVQITGTGYNTTGMLYFQVGTPIARSFVSHTGTVQFTVSDYGVFGMGPAALFPAGGAGYVFDALTDDLYEGGLIIGTGSTQVSSAVHSYLFEPDFDFVPLPGGSITMMSPGPSAAQQTIAHYADTRADNPIGVEITQESFVKAPPDDDIVFLRFTLHNPTGTTMNNLYVGLFTDWDAQSFSSNAGGYDFTDQFLWTALNSGGQLSRFHGVKLLDGNLSAALTGEGGPTTIYLADNGGDGFTPSEKYNALRAGTGSATTYAAASTDIYQLTAAGPITIAPGGDAVVSCAIISGNTLADIRNAAQRAVSVPTDVTTPEPEVLPDKFTLYQNYPNPFNPVTRIAFDMPQAGEYRLSVFNSLGQQVYEKIGTARSGRVEIDWDADGLASGIYFYKVTIDDITASRKMMLLK